MARLTVITLLLLTTLGAVETDQRQSQEEWERRTFEKQPPELVLDAAGIKPGMVIGEVGAGPAAPITLSARSAFVLRRRRPDSF